MKKNSPLQRMKRKALANKNRAIIVGSIILLATIWFGGLCVQFSAPEIISGHKEIKCDLFNCIAANFRYGIGGLIFALMIDAAGFVYLYLKERDKGDRELMDDDRGFQYEMSGTYGTSEMLQEKNLRNYMEVEELQYTKGIIIGKLEKKGEPDKIISIPPDGKTYVHSPVTNKIVFENSNYNYQVPKRERLKINGNRHMMVVGPSGCGKSYCLARPAIIQSINQGESVIVTDPKGELLSDTYRYAQAHGYTTRILNLAHPEGSDAWNALEDVSGTQINIAAQDISNIIINNTSEGGAPKADVHTDGAKNLLTALILMVVTDTDAKRTGNANLAQVYNWATKGTDEIGAQMEAVFNSWPGGAELHPAYEAWSAFKSGSEKLLDNIRAGLTSRLQTLQDPIIKTITGTSEISLTEPGKSKCIYYIIMSDMSSTFRFLSSLFFTSLVNNLVKFSRTQPNLQLPVPVNMIMDEFIAIGNLPDFDKKLATVRSARINMVMIFQTLAQLQASYPDGLWETLISNCSTMICLACNDETTAEYLSARSGTATIALETTRHDRPMIEAGYVPTGAAHSYSLGKRPVMTPDEVMRLPSDKILIAVSSAHVYVANKFPYTDMINPDSLERVNMYEYIPAWRQNVKIKLDDDLPLRRTTSQQPVATADSPKQGSVEASTSEQQKDTIPNATTSGKNKSGLLTNAEAEKRKSETKKSKENAKEYAAMFGIGDATKEQHASDKKENTEDIPSVDISDEDTAESNYEGYQDYTDVDESTDLNDFTF